MIRKAAGKQIGTIVIPVFIDESAPDPELVGLHPLGIDHEGRTYKSQGRYFRLTDVHGRVVNEILA